MSFSIKNDSYGYLNIQYRILLMRKVIIFGSNGMAGHIIAQYLLETNKYQIVTVARNNANIVLDAQNKTDIDAFFRTVGLLKDDIIINCMGILVKDSDENPEKAILINSWLPHYLSTKCKEYNAKLITLSTDCVFNGFTGQYRETDYKNGIGIYAQSKALGEVINDTDLTFRMSIVGPEIKNGTGLFNWFMSQTADTKGYANVLWNGVTTLELAKGIDQAIEQNISGLYHFVYKEKISKYNMLVLFNKIWNKNIKIKATEYSNDIDKTLVNTRRDFIYEIPSYEIMFIEMKQWIETHKELYPNY